MQLIASLLGKLGYQYPPPVPEHRTRLTTREPEAPIEPAGALAPDQLRKSGPILLNLPAIRSRFSAIRGGRIVTNNGASTQLPDCLVETIRRLAETYENVHRGQSSASLRITSLFENAYQAMANFVGAASPREVIVYRGATEAINAVMYCLMAEFRDGDNMVTTMMEHNSNYVPWYGLTHEILPAFGVQVECRLARFDRATGELDLDHLASLVDSRTKLICCTGASNFLGTKPPLEKVRDIVHASGYEQPNGLKRSYMLVDGAQLVPNTYVDVSRIGADFLAWSFHKMLAPVGVGALYAREDILATLRPFQYGGDMIAEGEVTPEHVGYNALPWRFTAGTPNIIGTIVAGQATGLLVDMVLGTETTEKWDCASPLPVSARADVHKAMSSVEQHENTLSACLIEGLSRLDHVTVYGPTNPSRRTSLVSFNIEGEDPLDIAQKLNERGIESRAGCHCATLAHHYYGLSPPASCRISPYIYNTIDEMEIVVEAVRDISKQRLLVAGAGGVVKKIPAAIAAGGRSHESSAQYGQWISG